MLPEEYPTLFPLLFAPMQNAVIRFFWSFCGAFFNDKESERIATLGRHRSRSAGHHNRNEAGSRSTTMVPDSIADAMLVRRCNIPGPLRAYCRHLGRLHPFILSHPAFVAVASYVGVFSLFFEP